MYRTRYIKRIPPLGFIRLVHWGVLLLMVLLFLHLYRQAVFISEIPIGKSIMQFVLSMLMAPYSQAMILLMKNIVAPL